MDDVKTTDRKALVYKGCPPDHCCCDTALRILPNGEFAVFFMTGGPVEPDIHNHVVLCRSSDPATAWSRPPETVLRPRERACTLSEVTVTANRIVVHVALHGGAFDAWTNATVASDDNGRTWTEPVPFDPMPRRSFIRNRLVTSWGEWLFPYQTYDTVDDWTAPPHRDGSFKRPVNGALITADQGKSWTVSRGVQGANGWAEPNVVELSDRSLVMLIRSDGDGCLRRRNRRF